MGFCNLTPVSLVNEKNVDEAQIQDYIFTHPEVLNIGEVKGYKREKIQSAGRIDMILEDGDLWYEVEVQLGATDPSHIIRTIEYWDNERWKYPQLDHCAVIIAESLTGRFFNVISLFNKHIPLIAIQMSAFKNENGEIQLTFSKVLDMVTREVEGQNVVYDKKFWIEKTSADRIGMTEEVFSDLLPNEDGYKMKFNKYYIGVLKDGVVKNFVEFEPQKNALVLRIKLPEEESTNKILSGVNYKYDNQWGRYNVKITSSASYYEKKDLLMPLIENAKQLMGIE